MLIVGAILKSIDPKIQRTIGKGKSRKHILLNDALEEFDLKNKSLVLDLEKKVIYKYIEVEKKHERYKYLIHKMKLGDNRPLIVYANYDAGKKNPPMIEKTPPITKKLSPNKRINFNKNYTYFDIGDIKLVKMEQSDELVKELEKLAKLQSQHKDLADQVSDEKSAMFKVELEKTVKQYEEKIHTYKKELLRLIRQMQTQKEKDIEDIVNKAREVKRVEKTLEKTREDNIV